MRVNNVGFEIFDNFFVLFNIDISFAPDGRNKRTVEF